MVAAKAFSKERKYDEALSRLNTILRLTPNDYRALTLKAHILYRLKKLDEALNLQLKSMFIENVYHESSYILLAKIYAALNLPNKAIKAINEVIKNNPANPRALGLLARMHLIQNELEEAFIVIKEKLEVDEDDTHALSLMVEYYYKKDQLALALRVTNRLVESHKPKKGQLRVPKAYIVGLALRAKVLTAINAEPLKALKDLETLEGYFDELFPWLVKLKAEVLYKSGKVSDSQRVLRRLVNTSNEKDLSVVAALVRIEQEGDSDGKNDFLNLLFNALSDEEVKLTLMLAKEMDWDYFPTDDDETQSSRFLVNTFWSSLYNMPVNNFTRKSTF